MKLINDLYQYRELLKTNVKKEIRGKYKGSFLGVLWSFINPLLTILVYAIVFPFIMRDRPDNFLVFLTIGIIPWNFFTVVMNQGMISIRTNEAIIKKVYFPREILPISVAVSGLVNFWISSLIILVICLVGGVGISWHIVLLPIISFIQFVFTLGLILALSAINIYIKDTEYIVQFIINILFYGTPILYNVSMFSSSKIISFLLNANPLGHIINAYRDIFLYHQVISIGSLVYIIIFALIVFILGLFIFRKLQKGFAEEI